MNNFEEKVDVLKPPTFEKSGVIKTREQALGDGDWIGTFNLWIVQSNPTPSIVYQLRSPNKVWAPDKLDVAAAGHYMAGEEIQDGLREVREELGKDYEYENLTYLGRKVHVGPDTKGRIHNNMIEVFIAIDNSPLNTYKLQEEELYAIFRLPIKNLLAVHTQDGYSFDAKGLRFDGKEEKIIVTKDSFPYNWDNYHFKMAILADRFLKGEKNLIY